MFVIVLPDIASDDDLLKQANRGDQDAIRVIYEKYFEPIYQFSRLRVENVQVAEDLAGTVFLEFVRAIGGGTPPRRNLRAWLFRVARNKLYDHYGEKKRLREVVLDEWIPGSPTDNPEVQLTHQLDIQLVRQALLQLTEAQQEVLVLRFGHMLDLEETADLMGKTVGAVKSLQFRAMDALRHLLSEEETGHD